MEKMSKQRPDVIVLDLELPRMHGLTFLSRIMAEDPIPVVVCSALTGDGTDLAMRALDEGALAIVTKPKHQHPRVPRRVGAWSSSTPCAAPPRPASASAA